MGLGDISATLIEAGFAEFADEIIASIRPSIRLTPTSTAMDDLPLGASRLGGLPDIPAGWGLPPLSFVAQINLIDAAPHDHEHLLPDRGWLYFFYDAENQPWGELSQVGGWQVVYAPDPTLPLHRAAGALSPDVRQYSACRLTFDAEPTAISPLYFVDRIKPDWDRLTRLHSVYDDLLLSGGAVIHRMLGHPDEVQGLVQREWVLPAGGLNYSDRDHPRRAELLSTLHDWRLLLQVDSDSKCGMMWGDVGRLYYGIHKDDLAARAFDRVWLSMQCS